MLKDNHDREFPYLRISITDVCNFSCQYCLPNGYKSTGSAKFLSLDEIKRLVAAFSELGVFKIRITGGEPTIRKDFVDIVQAVNSIEGITNIAFTTNGYRLKDNAQKFRQAGVSSVNVSIDSLKAQKFHSITKQDKLDDVLQGVHNAIDAGFKNVKLNAVLLKGFNDDELEDYMALVKNTPITARFIELMQTGTNLEYFNKHHLSVRGFQNHLTQKGWTSTTQVYGAGPAVNFTHPDYQGSIGFIAPYSKDFCKGCNRLRVTARGDLRLCLFGESGVPMRHLLQDDDQKQQLQDLVAGQLDYKKSSHFLLDGNTGMTPHLASIGG